MLKYFQFTILVDSTTNEVIICLSGNTDKTLFPPLTFSRSDTCVVELDRNITFKIHTHYIHTNYIYKESWKNYVLWAANQYIIWFLKDRVTRKTEVMMLNIQNKFV